MNMRTNRGGSRTAAKSKLELFVLIVNGFQPLTIITKLHLGCCSSPRYATEHTEKAVIISTICSNYSNISDKNLPWDSLSHVFNGQYGVNSSRLLRSSLTESEHAEY